MIAVSTLLVSSFMAYANSLRSSAEMQQLRNLMDHTAARCTRLLVMTIALSASSEEFLQMPTTIGTKEYWLRLRNDSTEAWLEGGLGSHPVDGVELYVHLPKEAHAVGQYVGGYGAARLMCEMIANRPRIQLTDSSAVV